MGQKLIHLHSATATSINATSIEFGEIAVAYKADQPQLFIRTGNNATDFASFIDSAAVEVKVNAAKDTIDAYTVNGKKISDSPVLGGGDIALSGYTKPESTSAITTADTVNVAFGKLEAKVDAAVAGGVTAIQQGNGIKVETTGEGITSTTPKVSAVVGEDDKFLAVDNHGITSHIDIVYSGKTETQPAKIVLLGKNDEVVSFIDASVFIKDGILYDQTVQIATAATMTVSFPKGDNHEYTGLIVDDPYLFLEFDNGLGESTSKSFDACNMKSLVDVYTAGAGLQLGTGVDSHTFSIKLAEGSADALTVDENGLKLDLSTIEEAIAAEETRATNAEAALQAAIDTEKTRAEDKENELSAAITAEASTARATETELDGKITTEKTRATNAEAALQAAINTEVSTARAAETELGGKIADEETRAKAVEQTLSNDLTELDHNLTALDLAVVKSVVIATDTEGKKDHSAGVTATRVDNEVTFDFANLVIDCGTF